MTIFVTASLCGMAIFLGTGVTLALLGRAQERREAIAAIMQERQRQHDRKQFSVDVALPDTPVPDTAQGLSVVVQITGRGASRLNGATT